MRKSVLTALPSQTHDQGIHPRFQPYLSSIDYEALEGSGPRAAISLASEALTVMGKLAELTCGGDPETLIMLAEADVTLTDVTAMAEALADRIETLFKNLH